MTYTIGDIAADVLAAVAEQRALMYDHYASGLAGPQHALSRDGFRQIAADLRLAALGLTDGEGVTRR